MSTKYRIYYRRVRSNDWDSIDFFKDSEELAILFFKDVKKVVKNNKDMMLKKYNEEKDSFEMVDPAKIRSMRGW